MSPVKRPILGTLLVVSLLLYPLGAAAITVVADPDPAEAGTQVTITATLDPAVTTAPGSYEAQVFVDGVSTAPQDFGDLIFSDSGATTFEIVASPPVPPAPEDGTVTVPSIDAAMQSVATTRPQEATAATISTICPAGVVEPRLQEDCGVLVGAALEDNPEATPALGQVTSDQASAPVDASHTSVEGQIQNIGRRIAALRSRSTRPPNSEPWTWNNLRSAPDTAPDEMLAGLAGATGGAAGDAAFDLGRWGLFVNASYSSGDRDGTPNVEGFDFDAWDITAGLDYRFAENAVAGAAIGYSENDTDLDRNGGTLDASAMSLSLYGTYYLPQGFYVDGILTYGWADYDQDRSIRYLIDSTNVDQTASASFDGSYWLAAVGGGYMLDRGALSLGPTLELTYLSTSVDGYTERMSSPNSDGGGWGTRIDDQDVTSFTSQLGAHLAYAVPTGWGLLTPAVSLNWVHEFDTGSETVRGAFVQDASRTPFLLPTDRPDSDYFNAQIAISGNFGLGRVGYLYYQKLFGYRHLDVDTIGAGVRIPF